MFLFSSNVLFNINIIKSGLRSPTAGGVAHRPSTKPQKLNIHSVTLYWSLD
ncbi:MAG: hypothetical protein V7K54_06440 [Nostoc sp.]